MRFSRAMLAMLLMLFAGCGSVPVEQYRDERPVLDLQRYFDGTIDAWGHVPGPQRQGGEAFHRTY